MGVLVAEPTEIIDTVVDPKTKSKTYVRRSNFHAYYRRLAFLGIGENYGLACFNYTGWASSSHLVLFTHDGHQLGHSHWLGAGGELEFLPDIADILAQSDDPEVITILFGRPFPRPHS